jgi:hypothetical protein
MKGGRGLNEGLRILKNVMCTNFPFRIRLN